MALDLTQLAGLTAHEAGDHPVEGAALEVQRLARLARALLARAERAEVLGRARRDAREQPDLDAPRRRAAAAAAAPPRPFASSASPRQGARPAPRDRALKKGVAAEQRGPLPSDARCDVIPALLIGGIGRAAPPTAALPPG